VSSHGNRALLALALASAACAGGAEEEERFPPGTALAVEGLPIARAEVEAVAERLRLIYPDRAESFLLTSALGSFILPRAAVCAAYTEERQRASAACAEAQSALAAGLAPELPEHRGAWDRLSLEYWDAARALEPGAWSAPVERIGSFGLVQLVARGAATELAAEQELVIRVQEFSYVPAGFDPAALEAALAAARLEVVDPAFDALLPEDLRYKMRGRDYPQR
jgi:hypothetical protein